MGPGSKDSAVVLEMVQYFEIGLSYEIWLVYQFLHSFWSHQFTYKIGFWNINTTKVKYIWFYGQELAKATHCFNQDVHGLVSNAGNGMSSTTLQMV